MKFPITSKFKLSETFLDNYKDVKPPFGFNGLGEFVFLRTYSRLKEDGTNEQWWETIRRVVEGIYSIQRQHIEDSGLEWNQPKAQKSAQEMYDRMFNFKILPPGRGLWAMGSPVIMEKGLTAALYNCSFVSTEDMDNPSKPFMYAMDMLMCGVGVGFDSFGANKIKIKEPGKRKITIVISDDREGWVASLGALIDSYFTSNYEVEFDYSLVRPEGVPIKTFGGVASGPKPLKELHESLRIILGEHVGEYISARTIVDIFNLIGKAVIAGNVRRSAELALGEATTEFLDLKDPEKNPDRVEFGWASNNSIVAETGMDYKDIAERIRINGEPGIFWINNARLYSRLKETEKDKKDFRVMGLNPCAEITLESYELCNLVELFPTNHTSLEDFKTSIKYAYLYAKTVTLLGTQWPESNRIMLRNRRIGLSMTGLAQFVSTHGIGELKDWMENGYRTAQYYDEVYSDWFAIPRSLKITTVKPSGTISLLAGVTPGVHYPESNYYIRRVRLANNSPFLYPLLDAGYKVEPAVGQEDSTMVVEFPISLGKDIRTLKDVSMWEQLNLAAFTQEHWADNSVSVTVTFDPEKEGHDIENALNYFQFKLKTVSFLPRLSYGAYPQMPYEEISQEKYEELSSKILPLDFSNLFSVEALGDKYCNNDTCAI